MFAVAAAERINSQNSTNCIEEALKTRTAEIAAPASFARQCGRFQVLTISRLIVFGVTAQPLA